MSKVKCKKCNSTDVVKNGHQKNGKEDLQRYYCKNCNRWFNEKELRLTKEELLVSEFIKNAFIFLRKNNSSNKKIIPAIALNKAVKIILDYISNNNKISNEQLRFENILSFFKDNAVAKLQEKEGRMQRPRKNKEYFINTNSNDFIIALRDKNTLFFANDFPDKKCKNLNIETPNYIINIQKRCGRYNNFFTEFEEAKKERRRNLKKKLDAQ